MLRRITHLITGLLATGLLLALAPSASAAATYDITQVGDADWVGITDADGNDATKTPLASNGANVKVTFDVHIDDMSRLAEGDTVTVPFGAASGSHYGPWGLFGSANLPRVLRNRDGVDMFTLTAPNAYTLTLTRTGDTPVGSFDGSVTVARQLWMSNVSATSSTWTVGNGHSITFANRKFENNVCGGNTPLTPEAKVDNGSVLLSANAANCGTMRRIAQGQGTDGISPDSLIGWYHITAESGAISKLALRGYNVRVMFAVDENTPGWWDGNSACYDLTRISGVDMSTFDKAKENLPVGRIAIERQPDGSWVYAFNLGTRLPGLENSLQVSRAGNETTLKLIDKTGRIWQYAQQIAYLHFADESIPNRVKVETQSTESAYRSTTLTTKPLDPAIGQGQSAIRYDPNGGKGDAFKKVGDPGTTATTAEAGVFLRKGHTFAGWNTKADGTGTAYQAGADVAYPAEGQTLTLYAQWKRVPETTMPDTGGTMNHRRLTTMLGGGACPHGPSVRPHAPAQAGLSHARRVMGHAEAHHPQTGHPCRSGRPAVRTRPVHARGAHRPRRRGIAAGDIHGIGQVVGARPETVRGREARTVGFIRPAGPVGRRAVGRVGVGHGGHLPVLRHFRHAADGHAGRRDVGHAAHGRERARLAVVPVRRLHQVRVV